LLDAELRGQPQALARLFERQGEHALELAAAFRRDDIRYILIASRGSSSNAARYAQYLLGRANRVPVMFATPSLYTIYGQPPRLDGAIVYRAIVRYDAYNELSGRQSTSIALLDEHRSGIVLSSIHHREQARLYVKQVVGGSAAVPLSPEEDEAVHAALAGEVPDARATPGDAG